MTEAFWALDHILISKGYDNPLPHRHLAKHLIFSSDSEFECVVENTSIRCKGICIDSNINHTVSQNEGGLLVFLFNETSILATELSEKYLKGKPFCVTEEKLSIEVNKQWEANRDDAKRLDEAVLSVCKLMQTVPTKYDNRIYKLIESVSKMEGIYEDTISILCDQVCLSQSRLSHLFKKEVGVSLSSYLVFEKMHKAYAYIAAGESITVASIRAGFGSSSHFSGVCKRMFGLAFTDFRKKTVLIEIP